MVYWSHTNVISIGSCVFARLTILRPTHRDHETCIVYSNWRRGVVVSVVRRMNEVTLRRARLVLGWMTVYGRVYHLDMQPAN